MGLNSVWVLRVRVTTFPRVDDREISVGTCCTAVEVVFYTILTCSYEYMKMSQLFLDDIEIV